VGMKLLLIRLQIMVCHNTLCEPTRAIRTCEFQVQRFSDSTTNRYLDWMHTTSIFILTSLSCLHLKLVR
jgi:hypothetical protein